MPVLQLIEDDLNKRSAKHTNKSTLLARGVDTQLGSSCVSAPLATNVDLWNPIGRTSFFPVLLSTAAFVRAYIATTVTVGN